MPSASRVTVSEAVTADLIGRDVYYTTSSDKVFATIVGINATSKYIYLDAPLTGVTYASGDKLTSAGCGKDGAAVFATMFFGANAYGTTDIGGGGIEHIVKQKGYGNDPLNQRSSVGWKATKAATRLVEEYMLRVESGSSFNGSSIETN